MRAVLHCSMTIRLQAIRGDTGRIGGEPDQRIAAATLVAAVLRIAEGGLEGERQNGLEEAPIAAAPALPGTKQAVLLIGGGLVKGAATVADAGLAVEDGEDLE